MGCTNERQEFNYNNLIDNKDLLVKDGVGPFFNPNFMNHKEILEKYKNNTWIDKLNSTIDKFRNNNCFGYRKSINATDFENTHTYVTFGQVDQWADNFAQNIRALKLVDELEYKFEGKLKILGLFARNCVDWLITDIACQRDSTTTVTFYSTLGEQSFDHIFEQTECKTVCVSNDSLDNLLKYHKHFNFKTLKNVIIYDLTLYADESMFKKVREAGLEVYSMKELVSEPKKDIKKELEKSKPDTVLTICYTSGTTGLPKGAKISQNNLFAGSFAIEDSFSELNDKTVHISYLPLAHVMERLCIHLVIGEGGLSCFIATGDVKKYLADDIALTRPTVLVAVPRVLTLFHQVITAQFKKLTGCAKSMLDRAYAAKVANFKSTGTLHHGLYDKLVFSKVRNKFGGRIKYFITGSAPLPMEVGNDMKLFFSAPIVEAYGMTEITGALTVTNFNDTANGMAGGPIRTMQLKLADRKHLNYHRDTQLDGEPSPTGEICCKGLSIFKGYFLEKEKTEEIYDEDGWLKTGDVGRILPNNKGLKIIDRVKELFKLCQGEYIAPSKLETVYVKCKYLTQICIYGNSFQSYVIGILCPNKVEIKKFLVSAGKIKEDEENLEKYYEDPDLHADIKKEFDELAKTNKFTSLEKPMKFIITREDFTVSNEQITPTMKLVRNKIQAAYQKELDRAYESKN